MNCSQVQEVLSAYYDGELPCETKAEVAGHLDGCARCSRRVAAFGQLSAAAQALPTPSPPPEMWTQLAQELDAAGDSRPAARQKIWMLTSRKVAAIAAALLLAVGVGSFAFVTFRGPHAPDQMAADLGDYLEAFQRSPLEAQKVLLASYEGEAVALAESAEQAGYRPAVASGLPESYSVDSVFVWKMPCCTCVQTLCKREDGSTVAIFEHGTDKPVRFGDCPCVSAECGGKKCSIVEGKPQLAVSWDHNGRQLTVIGARDMNEVNALVEWLVKAPAA